MKESIKLELRKSEIRQELLNDDLDSEKRDSLVIELRETESKWRAAVALEETETPDDETRDLDNLTSQVELRSYLDAATRGVAVTGAEAELNQELKLDTDGMVPFEAIAPVEERADDISNAPDTVSRTSASPLARIMARSVSTYLGISTPTVAAGERTYPVLSGGTSASTLAKGASVEAGAATWTTHEVSPVRASARYRWHVEDVARMGPALESSLRGDLSNVIASYLDDRGLNGDGVTPDPGGLLNSLTAPNPAPTTIVTIDDLVEAILARVDGLYADTESVVRLLLGPATYRKVAATKSTNGAFLIDGIRARTAGLRVSAKIPAVASDIEHGISYASGTPSSVVMPVWSGVRLIRDNVSNAAEGVVNLTAIWLYSYAALRTEQYAQLSFKVS